MITRRNFLKSSGSATLLTGVRVHTAKEYNLRVGFRVQLSSPNFQPKQLSMPDFLQDKIPLIKIGSRRGETHEKKKDDWDYIEPRYDHPEFKKAFRGFK